MTRLAFELPLALALGPPLAVAALVLSARSLRRRGLQWRRIAALASLRGVALAVLVLLAARPVWVETAAEARRRRSVVLLVDCSASMALEDDGTSRHRQALGFARDALLPALAAEGLRARALVFAADSRPVDGRELASSVPDGPRTDLAGAIVRALAGAEDAPLAIVALTDGAATEAAQDRRAMSALIEAGTPFIGVGFGSDTGARTLAVLGAEAPPVAPPRQEFALSARLEATGEGETPVFDLVLERDGRFLQKKTVAPGRGPRVWLEGFALTEEREGIHTYRVRLLPPPAGGLRCVADAAHAVVRISDEKEIRVLFAQGALTWDYKFVHLALRGDPAIRLTGLSRTSERSVFQQNVESAGELARGFPATLEELVPFRVVVLSALKPSDLSPAQQELLARYCGEFGGGVLMIGGAETFDASWRGSRLEELLPVQIAASGRPPGPDGPFRLVLTEEALRHPVFQVGDGGRRAEAWRTLPTFTHDARVAGAKPGAEVWAVRGKGAGADDRRVLMAAQRYGAGVSVIIGMQSLWRWRLARETDPRHFDRFWRQLFRHLAEGHRDDLAIRFPDQELRPGSAVRAVLERRPDPNDPSGASRPYAVRVADGAGAVVAERSVEVAPARPVDVTFPTGRAGLYTVTVLDAGRVPVASRTVEVKEAGVELRRAARDMETLRQWAALSDGLAVRAEDCRGAGDLIAWLRRRVEQPPLERAPHRPAGDDGRVLATLLAALAAEWALRKAWGLT